MLEQLANPITIQDEWGTMEMTHVAYSIEVSYHTKGGLVRRIYGKLDSDGEFIAYPKQHLLGKKLECYLHKKEVDELLAPGVGGKKKNQFRTDDVIDMMKIKILND